MSHNKYHEYTKCSLGLEYGFGDTCDCVGEAGSAGGEQNVQSSLRKRSGAAVQAFRGFPGATLQRPFQEEPIILLTAWFLSLCRAGKATRGS